MESYPSGISPQTLNLFEEEEASLENLRKIITTPVVFNSAEDIDPWHPSLL